MKAVLISIQPTWCMKIFNEEKTIEVRKSHPSIPTPFKVYVYETKARFVKSVRGACTTQGYGRGKVIGSFVCDRIDTYTFSGCNARYRINDVDLAKICLNHPELIAYGKGKTLYGWHITEQKLFDKPRDITEFAIYARCAQECSEYDICMKYDSEETRVECPDFAKVPLKRAPQSWCYVEEI